MVTCTNLYDTRESVMEVLLSEFDFSHVKRAYPGDLIVLVDHSRSFPLSF